MRSFRKAVKILAFIAVIALVNQILFIALAPYNYFHIDVQNMYEKDYEDVFVGTSHGKAAIHPKKVEEVTGKKGVNLCLGGEYLIDSYYMVKEILRVKNPDRIVYELDAGYWVTEASQGPDYATVYEEMPWSINKIQYHIDKMWDCDFRATLFPWYVYRQGYRNVLSNLKDRMIGGDEAYRAHLNNPYQTYGEDGEISIHYVDWEKSEENVAMWDESKLKEESLKYFDKLVSLLREEGVELVVVTTPVPQETLERYGENYREAHEFFTAYMAERGVAYYDFNYREIEGFDRSINGFSDYEGHMLVKNAEAFSRELGKLLRE